MSERAVWIAGINGLLISLVFTVAMVVSVPLWAEAGVDEGIAAAKALAGLGPLELMALLVVVETAALVMVVKLYIKREDRFVARLDGIEKDLEGRPCFYERKGEK